MKIVFYTSANFEEREVFRYYFAHVREIFPQVMIVAVRPDGKQRGPGWKSRWEKIDRKRKLLGGWLPLLEMALSKPIHRRIWRREMMEVERLMALHPRPDHTPDPADVITVPSVNGPEATSLFRSLEPDVILQAGAGILSREIFSLPRLATLNIHHGIAPLIRGMHSIHWALFENRPEWIGATLHEIDAGIDTGRVLAYAEIERVSPREGYPELYVRATVEIVERLREVLQSYSRGECVQLAEPKTGESVYRSTFSGWKMLRLRARGVGGATGEEQP